MTHIRTRNCGFPSDTSEGDLFHARTSLMLPCSKATLFGSPPDCIPDGRASNLRHGKAAFGSASPLVSTEDDDAAPFEITTTAIDETAGVRLTWMGAPPLSLTIPVGLVSGRWRGGAVVGAVEATGCGDESLFTDVPVAELGGCGEASIACKSTKSTLHQKIKRRLQAL